MIVEASKLNGDTDMLLQINIIDTLCRAYHPQVIMQSK